MRGTESVISGMKVISANDRINMPIIGKIGLMIFWNGISAIEQETNNKVPTGGVISPILKLNTIMIPTWTGSIPSMLNTGISIGVKMISAGVRSKKVPIINNITLISINSTILLSEIDKIKSLIILGIDAKLSAQPIIPEAATRKTQIEVGMMDSMKMPGRSFMLNSRYITDRMNENRTVIPAASVAVNRPPTIPPMMQKIRRSGGVASHSAIRICLIAGSF